jgi:hypothetical protein
MKKILLLCICLLVLVGCEPKEESKEEIKSYKVICTDSGEDYSYTVELNVSGYNNEVLSIDTTYKYNNLSDEEAVLNIKEGCPVENDTCEAYVEKDKSVFKWTIVDFKDYDSIDVENIKKLYTDSGYTCSKKVG